MTFYYEAHNKWGEAIVGEQEAANEADAAGKIREQGLFALRISNEPLGKAKYNKGALAVEETKTRIYDPDRDDIDEPSGTKAVDEHGEAVLPTKEELGSLRFKTAYKQPPPPVPAPETKPKIPDVEAAFMAPPELTVAPPISPWEHTLAVKMQRLSDTLATIAEWRQITMNAKKGDVLPVGVPNMGGKTWEFIASGLKGAVSGILQNMLEESINDARR